MMKRIVASFAALASIAALAADTVKVSDFGYEPHPELTVEDMRISCS